MNEADTFDARMTHLADLIEAVERDCAPNAIEPARDLLRAVLDVHESGLREILRVIEAQPDVSGESTVARLCASPSVASLLMMHGLHPERFEQRVQRALDTANEQMHGKGEVALLEIEGQRVMAHLRSNGPAFSPLLRRSVERLICEHAPDADLTLGEEEASAREQLIPITRLQRSRRSSAS